MSESLEGSTVLIADDEPAIGELLRDILEPEGATVQLANSGLEALKFIEAAEPDLAILDVRMPAPDGLALLQQIRAKGLDLPVLIITAQDSSTVTIEAMRRGAYDYLAKPFDVDEVLAVVQRAVEYRKLTRRVSELAEQVGKDGRDLIIGRSQAMQQVYKMIDRVADSNSTVLITGESGTGKELVAQVLHRTSSRREGPFVAVNCAALPETLLESELFGHEKGSFTGAMTMRKGRFEQAHKGTLFLDEIGEMTPATQKKLLRVLQERTFERVGGNVPIRVDVRVITATNRDLLYEAAVGSFRDDLYYRLNVINISMPPLRERKEDIPLLVDHFLTKNRQRGYGQAQISEAAMQVLLDYAWPGNVRQLENTIERAVVLAQGSLILPEHLLLEESGPSNDQTLTAVLLHLIRQGGSLNQMMMTLRNRIVRLSLERNRGDLAATARQLGIPEEELIL